MALARMQDLGGYRVVVDRNEDVDEVVRHVTQRAGDYYEVKRVTDYRDEGRETTGYRAIHVILQRDGCLIELQVRSKRQHGWAEAVERAANRTGFGLKDGEGPPEIVLYFKKASDALSELDQARQPSAAVIAEVGQLEQHLAEYLREPPALEQFAITPKSYATKENNWLLVYDWREGKRVHWMDCGSDAARAAEMFSEKEQQYPDYEVVLIGSDSEKTIEWTHAHYFGRSPDDLDPHGVLQQLRDLQNV
jgi:predicted SpoU family rRNA methylase